MFGQAGAFGEPLPGVQAERVRVPFADTVLGALPDGVEPDRALVATDVLATGHTAVARSGVRPGAVVAVVGAGPVGQMASLSAQAHGAGAVVVAEPLASRRDLAERLGAVAVAPERARAVVDTLTDGRGADAVVEAAGGAARLDDAIRLVRHRGTVVSVAVPGDGTWELSLRDAFVAELTVRFAVGNPIAQRDELLAALRTGLIDPSPVLTDRFPLAAAAQAYHAFSTRVSVKPLLTVWS